MESVLQARDDNAWTSATTESDANLAAEEVSPDFYFPGSVLRIF